MNAPITSAITIESRNADACGTYLQGYVTARLSEVVAALGEPCYTSGYTDGKTTHEWNIRVRLGNGFTTFTVYDWKTYDGGAQARSDARMQWNIGGHDASALTAARHFLGANVRAA